MKKQTAIAKCGSYKIIVNWDSKKYVCRIVEGNVLKAIVNVSKFSGYGATSHKGFELAAISAIRKALVDKQISRNSVEMLEGVPNCKIGGGLKSKGQYGGYRKLKDVWD